MKKCIALTSILLAALSAGAAAPNIILFIGDDIGWNDFGCYGNDSARTPHTDRLAENGLRFDQAFLTASSCSPSRSSIITGRYPHNNGEACELHRPISSHLIGFPALLREAGYYTVLSGKNHMTWKKPEAGENGGAKPFDKISGGKEKGNSGGHANWVKELRERPKDKPFFAWFAAHDAHRGWDSDSQWDAKEYGPMHTAKNVVVPPALIDNLETRQDLASYYNEVTRYDHFIGKVVDELKQQGQLENTLIFVLADNGRPFPRAKTRLHDSGMKTALVAHWPAGIQKPGRVVESLVSVIDLAPTCLGVAGAGVPESVQGLSLDPLLNGKQDAVRKAAFSEHNWHDYEALGRSVRADGYLFIRNFRPVQAWQGPADSVRSPSHQSLLKAGTRTPAQAEVLMAPRPEVELFQVQSDPHQLTNLAGNPGHAAAQQRLEGLLKTWMDVTGDSVPEQISADSFHRETGNRLKLKDDYKQPPPGHDRGADRINEPGPR